ncbi:MAG: hypothetical protein PGN13_00755 [Patulibacter minatonensis]
MSAPADRPTLRRPWRWWGAGPAHLIGHLLVIAVAAFALSVMFEERFAPRPWNLLLWLLGGAVLHDLVLLPAYSAVNIAAGRLLGADHERAVPILNHLRVPAVLSGVLLLTFAPRILDGQPQNYERALGHAPPDYLGRWLAVTAAFAVGSALVYVVRRLRADRASPDRSAPAGAAERSR